MSTSKKLFCLFFLFSSLFYPIETLAWNFTGHKVIAIIAYEHLTPSTRQAVDQLTKVMFKRGDGENRFIHAAIWLDVLRYQDVTAFSSWHFVDFPYSLDGTPTQPAEINHSIIWAIQQSEHVLTSTHASKKVKAVFLTALIHLVGDAHQPMHCINGFSAQHPSGDNGGNLFAIDFANANNLHQLWDEGVGLLTRHGNNTLSELANQIEQQNPMASLKGQIIQTNPFVWTKASTQIGIKFAYTLPEHGRPSSKYVKLGQQNSAEQLALAGYRLAYLLNSYKIARNYQHEYHP